MRILLAASGDFALPTFAALLVGGHEVPALITQPDRPAGRGRKLHVNRIKQAALDAAVPVLQPERLATPEMLRQVADLAPDVFLVIAYGQKVPAQMCALPPRGAINLHPSLLPELRGAAPANWAIIRGLSESGVSVMYLAPRIDAGDVLARRTLALGPHETAGELLDRLAPLGAELVADVLTQLAAGTHRPQPQDEARATLAPKLRKDDGLIDWNASAARLDALVRGLQPWPGAFTHLCRPDHGCRRIIIEKALPTDAPASPGVVPGTVVETGRALRVAAGAGTLELLSLKPESGKTMSAEAFCNGHQLRAGTVLGSHAASCRPADSCRS
jgi:methionyl-tRNA formyltransferase